MRQQNQTRLVKTMDDPTSLQGKYTLEKQWQTEKTEYVQMVNDSGLRIVVATTKATGSKHLLMPEDEAA